MLNNKQFKLNIQHCLMMRLCLQNLIRFILFGFVLVFIAATDSQTAAMAFWRKSAISMLIGILYFLYGIQTVQSRVAGKAGGGGGDWGPSE